MKPQQVSNAFQADLLNLMNKYHHGPLVKKLTARERVRLAADFQVYLLVCATKVIVPNGTQVAVDSVIASNCKTYEQFQRKYYQVTPTPQLSEENKKLDQQALENFNKGVEVK